MAILRRFSPPPPQQNGGLITAIASISAVGGDDAFDGHAEHASNAFIRHSDKPALMTGHAFQEIDGCRAR